jgi:dethiobiotin synthetase
MKTLASLAMATLLCACGAETVGTAAVQAQARKQEVETVQQTEARLRDQAEEAMRLNQEKLRAAEDGKP